MDYAVGQIKEVYEDIPEDFIMEVVQEKYPDLEQIEQDILQAYGGGNDEIQQLDNRDGYFSLDYCIRNEEDKEVGKGNHVFRDQQQKKIKHVHQFIQIYAFIKTSIFHLLQNIKNIPRNQNKMISQSLFRDLLEYKQYYPYIKY